MSRAFSMKRIPSRKEIFGSVLALKRVLTASNSKKKRVRFARDPAARNQVQCEYFGHSRPFPIDGSHKEMNPVWFCSLEMKVIQRDAKRAIGRDGGDSLCKKQYRALQTACQTAEGLASVLLSQSAAFCSSNHRGLETLLFPKNVLRRKVIQTVLARQEEIRQQEGVLDDNGTASLAVLCRAKTLTARRMARLLAAGDEYVAKEKPEAVWDDVACGLNLLEI